MLLAICFPLGLTAEATVARMLLKVREGLRPDMKDFREIVEEPGLVSLVFRLIGLTLTWMLLALVIAGVMFVIGLMGKAIAFGVSHHGAKMPAPHGWAWWFVLTFLLITAVLISRYSFVVPLFATKRVSGRDVLKAGVTLAKSNLSLLALINVCEYGLVLVIAHHIRAFEIGAVKTFAVATLSLLVTSAITCWFALLKADMAFGAAEQEMRSFPAPVLP